MSQSAYDSALAGVEDAKLAFYNYQNCKNAGASANGITGLDTNPELSCSEIVWLVEKSNRCDMVGIILGRYTTTTNDEGNEVMAVMNGSSLGPTGEVRIEESKDNSNNMQQAYTCVKLKTNLSDYRGTLTSSDMMRVVPVKLANVDAEDIKTVRISWYSDTSGSAYQYSNINGSQVNFLPLDSKPAAMPPTISVQLIQTAQNFTLADFDKVVDGNRTDRTNVFFVPTNDSGIASSQKNNQNYGGYIGIYTEGDNVINAGQMAKTNDKIVRNLPYVVYCNNDGDFLCSVEMRLPQPVKGDRNNSTFMFVISLPYGQPDTDFALEFCTANGNCGGSSVTETSDNRERLGDIQISIDSTGRANNLFRRVEARIDTSDVYFPYPLYAIELNGNNANDEQLRKELTVTSEYSEDTYNSYLSSLAQKLWTNN